MFALLGIEPHLQSNPQDLTKIKTLNTSGPLTTNFQVPVTGIVSAIKIAVFGVVYFASSASVGAEKRLCLCDIRQEFRQIYDLYPAVTTSESEMGWNACEFPVQLIREFRAKCAYDRGRNALLVSASTTAMPVAFFEEPTKKGLTKSYGEPSLSQYFAW